MDLDDRAGDGFVAVARGDVLQLELVGRRLADGDVDGWLLVLAHAPRCYAAAAGPCSPDGRRCRVRRHERRDHRGRSDERRGVRARTGGRAARAARGRTARAAHRGRDRRDRCRGRRGLPLAPGPGRAARRQRRRGRGPRPRGRRPRRGGSPRRPRARARRRLHDRRRDRGRAARAGRGRRARLPRPARRPQRPVEHDRGRAGLDGRRAPARRRGRGRRPGRPRRTAGPCSRPSACRSSPSAPVTAFEQEQIAARGLAAVPLDETAADPGGAAARALAALGDAAEVAVHFDVDVVDFLDAPLAENTDRQPGLPLAAAGAALRALLRDARVRAVTVTEFNPLHGDDATTGRLADVLAGAFAP